jgi:hypothetical protein
MELDTSVAIIFHSSIPFNIQKDLLLQRQFIQKILDLIQQRHEENLPIEDQEYLLQTVQHKVAIAITLVGTRPKICTSVFIRNLVPL